MKQAPSTHAHLGMDADWYAENFSSKEALGFIFRRAFLNKN